MASAPEVPEPKSGRGRVRRRAPLSDELEVVVPEAGLHLVAWLRGARRAREVAALAARHGLGIRAVTSPREGAPDREGLAFGFSAAPPAELRAGARTLARAIRGDARP